VLSTASKELVFILDYQVEKEAVLWYIQWKIQLVVVVKPVENCTFL
jgi:hypothetical protein